MEILTWQRPAWDSYTRTSNRKCVTCGQVATHEYIQTRQHEPADSAVFIPICHQCKGTDSANAALALSLGWSGLR